MVIYEMGSANLRNALETIYIHGLRFVGMLYYIIARYVILRLTPQTS